VRAMRARVRAWGVARGSVYADLDVGQEAPGGRQSGGAQGLLASREGVAADGRDLGGDDDERSVGRQPEELGGFPWVGRGEMSFEEGLEQCGALLLGGESLGRGFFPVAVGHLLAIGVENLPHLGAGSQHHLTAGADTPCGARDLFPHEPTTRSVSLQDGGEGNAIGGPAPSVLPGFGGGRRRVVAEAPQDGLEVDQARGSQGAMVDDTVSIERDGRFDGGGHLVGEVV
jgi:hypothetical protein